MNVNKRKLKKKLFFETGCSIQHNGWTCGSCFYPLADELNLNKESHLYWKAILWYRGDYNDFDWKKEHPTVDIKMFPQLIKEIYNKIGGYND
tara:strand:- start:491 stop:766 length:276 start_codon:yes stop_codon:yes gene_type:complete